MYVFDVPHDSHRYMYVTDVSGGSYMAGVRLLGNRFRGVGWRKGVASSWLFHIHFNGPSIPSTKMLPQRTIAGHGKEV